MGLLFLDSIGFQRGKNMMGELLMSVLLLSAASLTTGEISCRNEAGEPVDWFVVYKLPKYRINQSAGTGLEYLYLDSEAKEMQASRYFTNTTQSALGQVLQQLYKSYQNNDTAYMMYNDNPPGTTNYSTKYGHTKGVLMFDQQQGFWLIHSIPHFPPYPEDGFGYPDTGKLFGQSAICVTFKYDQFKLIAAQLLYYNPDVYNCSIPSAYRTSLWGLSRICLRQRFPWIEPSRLASLTSAGGEAFLNFAKSKYLMGDIFTVWMAQKLETDLLTETWQPEDKELPSNCSLPWHVYNIKRVARKNLSFYSRHDHSKWSVSRRRQDGWVCIGDLNRSPQQSRRSGGFICTKNKLMFSSFWTMVAFYSKCDTSPFYLRE